MFYSRFLLLCYFCFTIKLTALWKEVAAPVAVLFLPGKAAVTPVVGTIGRWAATGVHVGLFKPGMHVVDV